MVPPALDASGRVLGPIESLGVTVMWGPRCGWAWGTGRERGWGRFLFAQGTPGQGGGVSARLDPEDTLPRGMWEGTSSLAWRGDSAQLEARPLHISLRSAPGGAQGKEGWEGTALMAVTLPACPVLAKLLGTKILEAGRGRCSTSAPWRLIGATPDRAGLTPGSVPLVGSGAPLGSVGCVQGSMHPV